MVSFIRSAWAEFISPILRRPPLFQVAALCYRRDKRGLEILLVTSSSGNWILPKGWPIRGLDAKGAALREAWEEAGVMSGTSGRKPFASVNTIKRFNSGAVVPCQLDIYDIVVEKLRDDYPEADQRERNWVTPQEAVSMLGDPVVADVIERFAQEKA